MSDTLGGLVDKLCIVNMKLWHAQDAVYKYAQENRDAFASRPSDEVQDVLRKVADLNLQRNRLMTEIDRCFAEGLERGHADVDSRPKFT